MGDRTFRNGPITLKKAKKKQLPHTTNFMKRFGSERREKE